MEIRSRVRFLRTAVVAAVLLQVAGPIWAGQSEKAPQESGKNSKYFIYVNGIT